MAAVPTTHAKIRNNPVELTDELFLEAKAGNPNAIEDLIRAFFPMIERMAHSAAYRSFPADADRRADLADELISCGMETTWSLLSKTPAEDVDSYGKHLRKTAAGEMHGRSREVRFGADTEEWGVKAFGIALRFAEEHPASSTLEYHELLTVAADIASSDRMSRKYKMSKAKAQDMADLYLTPLSSDVDHADQHDSSGGCKSLADRFTSDIGNPEAEIFGAGLGVGEQIAVQGMYAAATRAALTRAVVAKIGTRNPRYADILTSLGEMSFDSDDDAADYMESLGHRFESTREFQRIRNNALAAFRKRWTGLDTETPEEEEAALSFLAADLGVEDLLSL